MQKTKLIQVLKTLDKQELKAFEKYLSKLYGEHELALDLFLYVKDFHPAFEDKKLDLDYITTRILKKEKTKRISNEASKLLGWLEEFLLLEKIRKNKNHYETQKLMIDIYKERKLDQFYFKEIDKAKTTVRETRKDLWRAFYLMELEHAYYYHPFTDKLDVDQTALQRAHSELDTFFKLIRIKYLCELNSRKAILNIAHKEAFFDMPEAPHHTDTLYAHLYNLYSKAHNLIEQKDPTIYNALWNDLQALGSSLDPEDHFIILGYMINYVAQLIRAGNKSAVAEAFKLYKYGIAKEIMTVGGYITEARFQNIINLACELNEIGWAEAFVKDNEAFLRTEWSKDTLPLARARIHFAKKEYKEALPLLRIVHNKNDAFNLNSRIIELQCFYELRDENEDQLYNGIVNFYAQLKRNSVLNPSILASAHHFLNILKLIMNGNSTSAEINDQLKSAPSIVGKYWLEEKIQELPLKKRQLRI